MIVSTAEGAKSESQIVTHGFERIIPQIDEGGIPAVSDENALRKAGISIQDDCKAASSAGAARRV
jgi:hypothetical protein